MGRLAKYTRRAFLITSAAVAGGVAFGVYESWRVPPNPLDPGEGRAALNPWLIIARDGAVTIVTPRAEMGQGTQTTLAALVAEELDVAWEVITTIHGPPAEAYYNGAIMGLGLPFRDYDIRPWQKKVREATDFLPKMLSLQVTGGSTSMIDGFEKMRFAGASARETLKLAAAKRLGVPAGTLRTEAGRVIAPGGQALTYGELAEESAKLDPVRDVALRAPSEWKYLRRPMPRLDMAAKCTGTATFGADVTLPGMKFATVRMNPARAGMKSFDAGAAEGMAGVEKIVDLGDGIAVIATNTWLAFQAAEAVEIEWEPPAYPGETDALEAEIAAALDGPANSHLRDDGDAARALESPPEGAVAVEAEYRLPWLAHACMEPMNATAHLDDTGHLTIWSPNQAPVLARDKAAEATGISADDITLHTTFLGGGFGRRAEYDFTVLAARVAAAVPGVPVKVMWSREEDMAHDFYRPAAVARLRGLVHGGKTIALEARVAASSVTRQSMRRISGFAPPGPDKGHVEGIADQPYAIANYSVYGHLADIALPVGFWRSVGNSFNGFFHESFIDELAHAAGADPLAFRLAHIRPEHAPSAQLLEKVGEMAGWSEAKRPGTGRGVAFTYSFGTPVAQVIEVAESPEGIRIERAFIAVDPGIALDPAIIEAQMESGLLFGLSAAVFGEITFAGGAAEQGNFPDYEVLRIHNAPKIAVAILENNRGPDGSRIGGIGEPGTPPAAPALANALFDLTGKRPRRLPLQRDFDFFL